MLFSLPIFLFRFVWRQSEFAFFGASASVDALFILKGEKIMFCLKCGKQIDDSAIKCPYCDCPTENAGDAINTDVLDPSIKSSKSFGIAAIVLGALGILWAILFAIFGWIFGGTGLALGLVGRNKNKFEKTCKIGTILSAIALGCAFINSLIGFLMMM